MTSFDNLGISPEIMQALSDLEFVNPTEIQEKAIPLLRDKHADLIALAQTGTGKTAAFGIPILHNIPRRW
jgi:ATP-dependent RNA helicase DeaD